MRHLFRTLSCTVVILAGPTISAQSADTCKTRNVVVNVRDKSGKLIVGLPPTSFRITLQGQPAKVVSSKVEIALPRVVLVLDASGSMTFLKGKWQDARLATEDIIKCPVPMRLALVVFAEGVFEVMDFGHTSGQILARIEQLSDSEKVTPKGKGRTSLRDAILRATDLLGTPLPGDTIYAVTDGGDNASRASTKDLKRTLIARGTRFFAFIFENTPHESEDETLGAIETGEIARDTGGSDVSFSIGLYNKASAPLPSALPQLYDQIAYFYQLEVALPFTTGKGLRWNIDVLDDHGQRRKDVTVYYPRDAAPCSEAIAQH